MNLAPIVLFVYNRPTHTEQTLNALAQNHLAAESMLYVFADGPKEDASAQQLKDIEQVRNIAKGESRFKQIVINEAGSNLGLAASIIAGVTDIVNKHGKIIVVEDDLVTSTQFLKYMNDGLTLFVENKEIGSICAYWDSKIQYSQIPDFFLLNGGDCWGWATWQDRWDKFIPDATYIKSELLKTNKISLFDYGGMISMLDNQIHGLINSWHIRWQGSLILSNLISVFPKNSFIKNIGLDGSGTHGDIITNYSDPYTSLNDYNIDLKIYNIDILKKGHLKNEKKIRKLIFRTHTSWYVNMQKIKRKISELKNHIYNKTNGRTKKAIT